MKCLKRGTATLHETNPMAFVMVSYKLLFFLYYIGSLRCVYIQFKFLLCINQFITENRFETFFYRSFQTGIARENIKKSKPYRSKKKFYLYKSTVQDILHRKNYQKKK